jgi:hypothetical protein
MLKIVNFLGINYVWVYVKFQLPLLLIFSVVGLRYRFHRSCDVLLWLFMCL